MSVAAAGPGPRQPAESAAETARRYAAGDATGQDLAEQRLSRAIRELTPPDDATRPAPGDPIRPGSGLSVGSCLDLLGAQLASRHLDVAARWLRARGAGYYTIGSSGHEGNAAVAAALRLTDPALLHYRSGAFYLVRAAQAYPPRDGVSDVLLGLMAAAAEPIAGGRHKVFGHPELHVIPQTSTIASHLPRAVGLAFAVGRASKLGLSTPWPSDCVVACSFGDASVNHSTAAGALSMASYCAYQRLPLPILLVCEDNGLGISVRTAPGWIEAMSSRRPELKYFSADGADLADSYDTAVAAAQWAREHRAPAFLHLRTVRLGGHAGTDVESAYRSPAEIAADTTRDPLLGTARLLVAVGALTPAEILDRYEAVRARILAVAEALAGTAQLSTAEQVMAPIAPRRPAILAANLAARSRQAASPPDQPPAEPAGNAPLTLAQAINRTLADELARRPGMIVFGEDVGRKGGVYGVTRGLQRTFGAGRVFDSPLDEQSILGVALGAGLAGLLPVPEIQYLAYLHNAADQLRGEAATLSFFSRAQYRNPMVVRVAGLAYQRGFGGHFHNDNGLAALRDIPGLVVACPARPDDAAAMLRSCLAAAEVDGSVSVFLEPIALYHERDCYEPGDGDWLAGYEPPDRWGQAHIPLGRARLYGTGTDLTIISFGNGVRMSLRAARTLAADGIACRVLDLRWLAPLPYEDVLRAAAATGTVLVADETRRTGGVSETVITTLVDAGFTGRIARVASQDSFVPLGDAAGTVLLSEAGIEDAARDLFR
ncbi:MAG: transketolase C-terminal domain-containing protein [Streptosporangiaceae bacterium]